MNIILSSIILITFLFVTSCDSEDKAIYSYTSFNISKVSPSLVSEDHTSEGVLFTMTNGRVIHFFRLDCGIEGDHTSNGGAIYKRYSDDNANSWSSPELIYDTPGLDDRNIGGGLINSGGGGYY